MNTKIFLSIIIPAYNEENRLPNTLEQIISYLKEQTYNAEVLIVENGSIDRTAEIANLFAIRYSEKPSPSMPKVRLIKEASKGKGLAVKRGMLEASGKYRFMCDADLSMPISELSKFLPPTRSDTDIGIGSREAPGALRVNEPQYRHYGGRLVNFMIRWLALPGFHDTQCGFKCFKDHVAEDLFNLQSLTGWSFDIELLFLARKRDYKIVEIPIEWHFNPESKLNLIKDSFKMFKDILTIRINTIFGKYSL